ncbi:hypothetical protein HDV01_006566 [Terramyces sp. JEL0728]|nr:hypothetical protein HDV01_006566 [Terramyces sp. JEL0728]
MNIDLSLIKEKRFVQTEWICLVQAYACSKHVPMEHKHFKYWDVAKDNQNSVISVEIIIQWLKKALHYALVQNYSQGSYNVSIAYLDIFNESLFSQPKSVLDFGLTIANAMDNGKSNPEWTVTYNMTLVYAIVKSSSSVEENWKNCSKLIAISSQICKLSKIPVKIYMKYIGLIYQQIHDTKCVWPGSTAALTVFFDIESLIHFGKGNLLQIIGDLKLLNSTSVDKKPSDIFLDHLWIHFELFQHTTSNGMIAESRSLMEELQRFKIVNPEYIAKKKLLYQLIKVKKIIERGLSIPKIENYLYHISNDILTAFEHGWEMLGIEICISLWNIILPVADKLPKKLAQKLTLLIEKSFSQMKNFDHDIKQVIKAELKKFKRYSNSIISAENNLSQLIESHMIEDENEQHADLFKKGGIPLILVSELLYMAESSEPELVQILLQKALLEILPQYSYVENRFLSPDQGVYSAESSYYPILFEFFKRCQKFCIQPEQSDAQILANWDMLFVAAKNLINLIDNHRTEVGDEDEFDIYFTLVNVMLVGFRKHVNESDTNKFVEYVLNLNINLLEISKKKKLHHLEYNAGVQFWKTYVTAYEKPMNELWVEPVTRFYEYCDETHMKKSNMGILISKIYAVIELDIYTALAAKNAGIKNAKDNSAVHLKNAEECLKIAATSNTADMRTLLILIPIWNRIQQCKPPSKDSTIASLEFEMPEVKLWYQFDQTIKPDPKQAQKETETFELLVANVLNHKNFPAALKMRMVTKLAKMAQDLNQQSIALGLFTGGLHFAGFISKLKQYNSFDVLAAYNVCHAVECLHGIAQIGQTTTEIQNSVLHQLLQLVKQTTVLTSSISINSLSMILGCYWNAVFYNLKQTDAVSFELLSLLLTRITAIFGPSKINNVLKDTEASIIRTIFCTVVDYYVDTNQIQTALKYIELATKLLPKHCFAPLWARKYNINRTLGINVDYIIPVNYDPNYGDVITMAGIVKTPEDKLLMFQKAHRMIVANSLAQEHSCFRLLNYYECYDNPTLKLMTEELPKEFSNPYDCLFSVHLLKDSLSKEDSDKKEILGKINTVVLEMMQQLFTSTNKNSQNIEVVPQVKPKSVKGKKGGAEQAAAPEMAEVTLPASWEAYSFPKSVKSQFLAKNLDCIAKAVIERPIKLILDIISIIDRNMSESQPELAHILLKFIELIADGFNNVYPILSYFSDLVTAYVLEKCGKTQQSNDVYKVYLSKYSEYTEKALYLEESVIQLKLEEKDLKELHFIAVDYMIEFGDFTAAVNTISLILHSVQCRAAEANALLKLSHIHLLNKNCMDALAISQKGIEMVPEDSDLFYKHFALQYIASTQMFENHDDKKKGITSMFAKRIVDCKYIEKAINIANCSKLGCNLVRNWCIFYLNIAIYLEKATKEKHAFIALQKLYQLLDSDCLHGIFDECLILILKSNFDHSFLTAVSESQIIKHINNSKCPSEHYTELQVVFLVFKSIQTIRFYFKPQDNSNLPELNPVEEYLKMTDPENLTKDVKEINPMESLALLVTLVGNLNLPEHLKYYYDFSQGVHFYLKTISTSAEESKQHAEKALSFFNELIDVFIAKDDIYLLKVVSKCSFILLSSIFSDHSEASKYQGTAIFTICASTDKLKLFVSVSIKKNDVTKGADKKKTPDDAFIVESLVHNLNEQVTASDIEQALLKCGSVGFLKDADSETDKPGIISEGCHIILLLDQITEEIYVEDIIWDNFKKVKTVTRDFSISIFMNRKKVEPPVENVKKKDEPKGKKDKEKKKEEDTVPGKMNDIYIVTSKLRDVLDGTTEHFKHRDLADAVYEDLDEMCKAQMVLFAGIQNSIDISCGPFVSGILAVALTFLYDIPNHRLNKFDVMSKVKAAIFTIFGILSYTVPSYPITESLALKIVKNIQVELKNGGGNICQIVAKSNPYPQVKLMTFGQNVPCHI